MTNKQIQPVRSRDYQITQRSRPRGLWGQVWMVVLQPAYFFRTLPLLEDTRTWLWAAVLILALAGITSVRQDAVLNGDTGAPPVDFGGPPGRDVGGDSTGVISSGGGAFQAIPIDGGGGGGGDIPLDGGIPPGIPTPGSTASVTTTWTTALLAGSAIVLGWFVLSVILSEVTLFNGRAPSLGQNFQVAIWASVPFALMGVLQLIYFAAGGQAGGAGLSGLLAEWEDYTILPTFWQSVILSLTSRLTVFWLWSLILLYIGARNALQGKRWASVLVVVVWVILLVVVPVITGAVKAPETVNASDVPTGFSSMEGQLGDPLAVPGESYVTGEKQEQGAAVEDITEEGTLIEATAIPFKSSGSSEEPAASPEVEQSEGASPVIVKPVPGG